MSVQAKKLFVLSYKKLVHRVRLLCMYIQSRWK